MFWRFGFHACSAIDTLLDKPDVTLEEILSEDDLLQECKAHNTKLIEYLRDPKILSKLLNYIIADEQVDDKAKFKYSYVSCEVLSCEIWSICETVVQSRELLSNFWTFLDRPSPLNPLQASYFTKVNEQFLEKKTDEMIPFIQSIPDIVPKLLRHIETSSIMDLLLKVISMEKSESGSGIVEWLHDEGLISALLAQMNPRIEPEIQGTVADVLKAIIAISANSSDAGVIGPNALSRELVSETTISRILDHMLDPYAPYSTASLTNGVSLIIELIRKNNSDYDIEPVLNLTLETHPPTSRDPIYLGIMLRLFASRIDDFQKLLAKPKSVPLSIATTFGPIQPLGFERFRICELYAELLHCSNMVLLNDPRGEQIVHERDVERERLRKEAHANPTKVDIWGDADLETSRQQWAADTSLSDDNKGGEPGEHDITVLSNTERVSNNNTDHTIILASGHQSASTASGEYSNPITDSVAMEKLIHGVDRKQDNWHSTQDEFLAARISSLAMSSETDFEPESDGGSRTTQTFRGVNGEPPVEETSTSSATNPSTEFPVVGDYLKMQFVKAKVLPSVVNLFFSHPWNNFLHNVVYDILTQVLNGPMDKGFNRQLVVDLFTTGELIEKIMRGQKASDEAQARQKGVRLGYMGHLTLIAEEVLKLAERIPLELLDPLVVQKLTSPEWNEYVDVTLAATRTRDNAILGGVRPQPSGLTSGLSSSALGGGASELAGIDKNAVLNAIVGRDPRYENGNVAQSHDEFDDDSEERESSAEPFARYMSQRLVNDPPDKFGSSDEDDDDEEVVGWIGEGGEFEARDRDRDEIEDEDDVREFGRRGLFHERWEADFHDDDDFGFRSLGTGSLGAEQHINSSDDEEGDQGSVKLSQEELEQELGLAASIDDLATSVDNTEPHNDRKPFLVDQRRLGIKSSSENDVSDRGLTISPLMEHGDVVENSPLRRGDFEKFDEDLSDQGTRDRHTNLDIRPDDVD